MAKKAKVGEEIHKKIAEQITKAIQDAVKASGDQHVPANNEVVSKIEKDVCAAFNVEPEDYRAFGAKKHNPELAVKMIDKKMKDMELTEKLDVGTKVKIADLSGVYSNREGTIVDKTKIKTDGKGIPTNVDNNPYKPVDWSKESAVEFKDGKLITMFNERIIKMNEAKDYKALSQVLTKKRIMSFEEFRKNDVKIEKGEEELVKASMTGERTGKDATEVLDDVKTEKGTASAVGGKAGYETKLDDTKKIAINNKD
jgi:hypothetical protein